MKSPNCYTIALTCHIRLCPHLPLPLLLLATKLACPLFYMSTLLVYSTAWTFLYQEISGQIMIGVVNMWSG